MTLMIVFSMKTRRCHWEEHQCGQFSMAAVQSNMNMEDKSKVQVGNGALKVGIYYGYKGDSFQSIYWVYCLFLSASFSYVVFGSYLYACMHAYPIEKYVSCFNTLYLWLYDCTTTMAAFAEYMNVFIVKACWLGQN